MRAPQTLVRSAWVVARRLRGGLQGWRLMALRPSGTRRQGHGNARPDSRDGAAGAARPRRVIRRLPGRVAGDDKLRRGAREDHRHRPRALRIEASTRRRRRVRHGARCRRDLRPARRVSRLGGPHDRSLTTMQKITPFLWFNDNAEEAMNFYVSIFKNSKVGKVTRYGDAGPGPKGQVMSATFQLEGQEFMA